MAAPSVPIPRADELTAARARAVQAADEERRRIGRDLHDGAQQRLIAIGHWLRLAERALPDDPTGAARLVSEARDQALAACRELRELARGLHPVALDHGLGPALAALAMQSPLPLRIGALPDRRLPPVVETTAWYLVSESISNAVKHAGATEVRVHVAVRAQKATIVVSDDGTGGACPAGGTGLRGLIERVASLGGTLALDSPPGAGTHLRATLPLVPWR
jgi:signal transduction histidine kinase